MHGVTVEDAPALRDAYALAWQAEGETLNAASANARVAGLLHAELAAPWVVPVEGPPDTI